MFGFSPYGNLFGQAANAETLRRREMEIDDYYRRLSGVNSAHSSYWQLYGGMEESKKPKSLREELTEELKSWLDI